MSSQSSLLNIELNAMRFHAFHGLYEEEKRDGNEFEVKAILQVDATNLIYNLAQTVDYSSIYQLIEERMQQPTPLLETLVQEMVHLILEKDNRIRSAFVSVSKLQPPIKNFSGNVAVSFTKWR